MKKINTVKNILDLNTVKVNSVQETCAKCFAVHILKFEILQPTWNNKTKNIKSARFIDEKLKTKSLMFFITFFHVICKISNFIMWTAKHLAQVSCTELTLKQQSYLLTSVNFSIFSIGEFVRFIGTKDLKQQSCHPFLIRFSLFSIRELVGLLLKDFLYIWMECYKKP